MSKRTAIIAGGCFWGIEELFRYQPGVIDTEVGYTGGENDHPTYQNHPGHAEAVKITYDDTQTNYRGILDYFFRIHDPTTLNRQGNDIGSSYRSAIFYKSEDQLKAARELIAATEKSGLYSGKVVTALEPFSKWWPAEEEHQDYLQKHPGGYTCHFERTAKPLAN